MKETKKMVVGAKKRLCMLVMMGAGGGSGAPYVYFIIEFGELSLVKRFVDSARAGFRHCEKIPLSFSSTIYICGDACACAIDSVR